MIRVTGYTPQRFNNTQMKRTNNTNFGMKVIQPPETVKGLTFDDMLLDRGASKVKEVIAEAASKFESGQPKLTPSQTGPFHMD